MKKKAETPAAGSAARKITTCLYNYVPEQEGELALVRGKLVTILAMEGNWWRGECQGEVSGRHGGCGRGSTDLVFLSNSRGCFRARLCAILTRGVNWWCRRSR